MLPRRQPNWIPTGLSDTAIPSLRESDRSALSNFLTFKDTPYLIFLFFVVLYCNFFPLFEKKKKQHREWYYSHGWTSARIGLGTEAACWFQDEHCVNQGCATKLLMRKQQDSTKAQDRLTPWREKPQSPCPPPAAKPARHLPTSAEARRKEPGGGGGTSLAWEKAVSLKNMERKQNAQFGQRHKYLKKTTKKANSAKSRQGKLQLNIGQHTDGMNVLRCGALEH